MWGKARELAALTPPERNRWVDFLGAISILAVVFGHRLMAGLYVDDAGALQRGDLIETVRWTHWLAWARLGISGHACVFPCWRIFQLCGLGRVFAKG